MDDMADNKYFVENPLVVEITGLPSLLQTMGKHTLQTFVAI